MNELDMQIKPSSVAKRDSLVKKSMMQAKGILHLGAHLGQERDKYSALDKQVLWVEANPYIFVRLKENIESDMV